MKHRYALPPSFCRSERCSRLLNIAASGRSYILTLFIATLLTGCATLPPPGCVAFGPRSHFCLLPPAALPQVSASHLVSIRRNGDRQTFLGHLQIDNHALRLAASSLFGTGLFTITWDGRRVTSSAPKNVQLHPDLIVAMLELAIADPAALRPRLHNLTLKVTHNVQRDLYAHGHLVAHIVTGPKPLNEAYIVMTIPPAHMTLVLRPVGGSAP